MKLTMLSILIVAAGVLAGYGAAALRVNATTERFEISDAGIDQAAAVANGPQAVVVGGDFDFGMMKRNESGSHVFVIRNDGKSKLDVTFSRYSCGMCVESLFTSGVAEPGQTLEVPVTFHTKKPAADFQESMEVTTNDPNAPVLTLAIRGLVAQEVRASSEDLNLGTVSAAGDSEARFRIFSYVGKELRLQEVRFKKPESAAFFQVTAEPLDQAAFAAEDHRAQAALDVRVKIAAGIPLGPFSQQLTLVAAPFESLPLEVSLRGVVGSNEITIYGGADFNRETNVLTLGRVAAAQGAASKVQLLVKGPRREQIQFQVESVDPADHLRAQFAEVKKFGNGAVLTHTLHVQVPPGVPAQQRMGTEQSPAAQIVLTCANADVPTIKIAVRFYVDEGTNGGR